MPFPVEPLVPCEATYYGDDAPFAFAMRIQMDGMSGYSSVAALCDFGYTHHGAPIAATNGMGLYWDNTTEELVGRVYDDAIAGWREVRAREAPGPGR